MNRLYVPFIVGMMIPTLMAQADVPLINPFHLIPIKPPTINISPPHPITPPPITPQIPNKPTRVPYDWLKNNLHKPTLLDNLLSNRAYSGFLSDLSPEYIINRNRLGLTKIVQDRKKRAIMFVFCMNKRTISGPSERRRAKIHIMCGQAERND
jgi:hypothetical protein